MRNSKTEDERKKEQVRQRHSDGEGWRKKEEEMENVR